MELLNGRHHQRGKTNVQPRGTNARPVCAKRAQHTESGGHVALMYTSADNSGHHKSTLEAAWAALSAHVAAQAAARPRYTFSGRSGSASLKVNFFCSPAGAPEMRAERAEATPETMDLAESSLKPRSFGAVT